MSYAIYTITNDQTGRIYVGMTTKPKTRFLGHLKDFRLGKHKNPGLMADYRNGHTFTYSVVMTDIEDKWTAKAAESDLIVGTPNAYNCQRSTTTRDKVIAIRALLAAGFNSGQIHRLFGINEATIHRVKYNKMYAAHA